MRDIIRPVTVLLDLAADLALRLAGANDDEVDDVVTEALGRLAERAGADRAYITLFFEDGTFANSHEWLLDGVVPQLPAIQRMRTDDFPYSSAIARRGEVWSAPHVEQLPDDAVAERASFSSFGVRAVLQVPIMVAGRCTGLIGLNHFRVTNGWDPTFIEVAARVGQVIGVVIERQRATESMQRAVEAAQRANRFKDHLLAHVSHEFRNPLHAILGYAELLELDELSSDDRDALTQIRFNGRHLLTMVDDMIMLARGDATGLTDVPIDDAVRHATDTLASVLEHRRIELLVDPTIGDATVRLEPGRLRQVLYCLLSGAVHGVRAGGSISIEHPGPNLLTVRVMGTETPDADLVMPMARVVLGESGEISVRHDDESCSIVVSFDAAG
jgi:signal transduction histidine kinase